MVRAALFASCPRCGARALWAGPATFAPTCLACGQDFAALEPHGRLLFVPVALAALLVGAGAMWLDSVVRPPLWVHGLVTVPLTALAVIGALRFAKAAVLMARLNRTSR